MSAIAVVDEVVEKKAAPPDDDHLLHIYCAVCLKNAKSRARPRKAFCGLERYVLKGNKSQITQYPLCAVCYEIGKSAPCSVCGTQAIL